MVSAPGGNRRCLRQASDTCTVFTIGKLSRSQKGVFRKLFVPLCRQNILKRSSCIFSAGFFGLPGLLCAGFGMEMRYHSLRLGKLFRRQPMMFAIVIEIMFTHDVPLFSTQSKPFVCLHHIGSHTIAVLVHQSEIGLSHRISFFGGQTIPLECLRPVFFDAPAILIQKSQIVHRAGITLFSRAPEPARRFRVVYAISAAAAMEIKLPQRVLCFSLALYSREAPPPDG